MQIKQMSAFNLLKSIAAFSATVLILVGSGLIAVAQEKKPIPKRVLVLYTFHEGSP